MGIWVHHCHILLHEDMGMMQTVQCVEDARSAKYRPRRRAAGHTMPGPEVDTICPPPPLDVMYGQAMRFVDPNEIGGQVNPGFALDVPELED